MSKLTLTKAFHFLSFLNYGNSKYQIGDQKLTNEHSPENINLLKSLVLKFCDSTKIKRPQINLLFWSASNGESYERITFCFDDNSKLSINHEHLSKFILEESAHA